MKLNGKVVNLRQLKSELAAAGVIVPALGTCEDDLHTYDASGVAVDVPASAAPVLAAHIAQPDPEPLRDQYQTAKSVLAAYLANGAPTQADSVAALKMVIRVLNEMAKRMAAD